MMRRLINFWIGLLVFGWIIFGLAGGKIARLLAAWLGPALLRVGQGKFIDAYSFIYHREFEILWLTSLITVIALCSTVLTGKALVWLKVNRLWHWSVLSLFLFVGVNVWVGSAERTCLYWGSMWNGKNTQALAQFQIKKLLLEENPVTPRAILIGSSQTGAEIDENLMNEVMGSRLWTTELHFPGSRSYDLFLVLRDVERTKPDYIICYFSEGYLFGGSVSVGLPYFFCWQSLADYRQLNSNPFARNEQMFYGLLGKILPLFYCRDVISQRLLGARMVQINKEKRDQSMEPNLTVRAAEMATYHRQNAQSDFQKTAFEKFLIECGKKPRRVVVCCGQLNPIAAAALDSRLRPEMLRFLEAMQKKYPYLTVLPREDFPEETASDYLDLTHVNPEAQARYTRRLIELLDKKFLSNPGEMRPENR